MATPVPQILYLDMVPGDPSQTLKLAGIRRYAALRGWEVVRVPRNWNRPLDVRSILELHNPMGIVVEGAARAFAYPPSLFGSVPVAYIEYPAAEVSGKAPNVVIDDAAVAAAAFRELSLGKPAAFAAVGHVNPHLFSRLRIRAFRRQCAEVGCSCREFPSRLGETASSHEARLAKWIAELPRNTAVFTATNAAAAAVTRAARAAMRHIPKELSLVAFGDIPEICESASPPITSIRFDFERMGFLAAKMLAARMKGRAERGMEGRAAHEMKGRAERGMEGPTCAGSGKSPLFAQRAHPSFGGSAATLHCGNAAPSFAQRAHPSLERAEDGNAAIGPLLATRRKSTSGRGRHEPWILKAVEIIRAEACEGLTIDELLGRLETEKGLPVSRRNFDRRFREAVGHTVNEEILSVRLEAACALLAQTNTPVMAIPDFCGFGCYRALDAVFRSRFKLSMRLWRERNAR